MVVVGKLTGQLVSPRPPSPQSATTTASSRPQPMSHHQCDFATSRRRSPHVEPQLTPQALLAALASTAAAAEPTVVSVDPVCNQPNNQLKLYPEAMDFGISSPEKPITLEENCCYPRDYDLGNQVCACRAWNDWCRDRHSTCCGESRACIDHCACIPHERYCDHPDNKFEKKCADPYKGQEGLDKSKHSKRDEPPTCPGDH